MKNKPDLVFVCRKCEHNLFGYSGDYHYNEANGLVIFESREFRIYSENLADDYSWNDLEIIGNTIDGVKKC